jgi:glucose-1-phosphate adenylyltransferase
MKQVLSVILGGGQGTRLFPLTKERCKPAVPLLGKYRLIDIPVSNCLNSDFNRIYVLTQFLSESLNKHISRTYKMDAFSKGFIEIMAAEQSMEDTHWFQGTADAVRRCLKHFNDPAIQHIFILSGDQLYKMNLADMYRYHVEKNADLTVACNRVAETEVSGLGIMGVDSENRIKRFSEKPKDAGEIDGMALSQTDGKKEFLGSMGIYLFKKKALVDLLFESKEVDFGREIIPAAIKKKDTYAYLFGGYWRDIGTIKGFYAENMAMTEPVPPIDMFDEKWQIFTRTRYLSPAKFDNCSVVRSIVAEGAIILSAKIERSVIGLRFRVEAGTEIENTVVMGCDYYQTSEQVAEDVSSGRPHLGVGRNCRIRRAILDKNVRIGDDVSILNEKNIQYADGPNYYIRDGITVIPKNAVVDPGTVI